MRSLRCLPLIFALCWSGCGAGEVDQDTRDSGQGGSAVSPRGSDDGSTVRNADTEGLAGAPPGQLEHATDLQISAAIRKSVIDDKSLSANAQNIKIIASDGVVTLRGPVKSEQEKQSIEALARRVDGVTQVDNLLEVDRTP